MTIRSSLRRGVFRVRPHRPGRTAFVMVSFLVVLVLGGWSIFEYGRQRGGHDSARARAAEARLRLEVAQLRERVEELTRRNTLLERADSIDRESISHLRRDIEERETRIDELEEELAFYRNLVSPTDSGPDMNLRGITLEPIAGNARRFRYELVLTQVNGGDSHVKGRVDWTLTGRGPEDETSLTADELLVDGESATDFRFKYFQTLDGIIELPDSFSPARLHLRVVPAGGRLDAFEEQFDWESLISGGA